MTRGLVIEAAGSLWGSERALLDLLGETKIAAAVCCPPRTPLIAELEKRRIPVLPYYIYGLHEKSKWQRLRAAVGVLRACLQFHPDVIYLNQSGSYKVVLPAAILLRTPMIAHIRIFEDAAYLAHQRPDPRRLRGLIAISSAVETEIRRFRELDPIPLHRIYDAYTPSPQPETTSSDRLDNRIACVGRVVPMKGQNVLVQAMGILKRSLPEAECLIAGEGDAGYVGELQRAAIENDSAGLLRWNGFVRDVVALLRTCSVLACPSHREPLGRVIFEAWEAGAVPVVFSGSGGAAEIVAASGGGITYDRQDAESLAQALLTAIRLDSAEKARLVSRGRSWMARHCDPVGYGAAISSILAGACLAPKPS